MRHLSARALICCFISGLFWTSDALAQEKSASAKQGPFGDFAADYVDFMNTDTPWKTWVAIPVLTRHFNRDAVSRDNLSEDNPGLGVERSNGRWHWLAGAYRNSNRRKSVYGMVAYTPLSVDLPAQSNLALGLAGGLLTGYNTQKGYPIVPAGGALISWETSYHFGADLFLVPTFKSYGVEGFAALQLKFSF
jgi:hypothetical protein